MKLGPLSAPESHSETLSALPLLGPHLGREDGAITRAPSVHSGLWHPEDGGHYFLGGVWEWGVCGGVPSPPPSPEPCTEPELSTDMAPWVGGWMSL